MGALSSPEPSEGECIPMTTAKRALLYWKANLSALPRTWKSAGRSGVSRWVGVKWMAGDFRYSIRRFVVELKMDKLKAWDLRRQRGIQLR